MRHVHSVWLEEDDQNLVQEVFMEAHVTPHIMLHVPSLWPEEDNKKVVRDNYTKMSG